MTLRHLGRCSCGELTQAMGYEWLVTNGIGGFASGTACETRPGVSPKCCVPI